MKRNIFRLGGGVGELWVGLVPGRIDATWRRRRRWRGSASETPEIFGQIPAPQPRKSKIKAQRWSDFRPFERDGVRGGGAETAIVWLKWATDAVEVPGCGRRRLCAAQTERSYGTLGEAKS